MLMMMMTAAIMAMARFEFPDGPVYFWLILTLLLLMMTMLMLMLMLLLLLMRMLMLTLMLTQQLLLTMMMVMMTVGISWEACTFNMVRGDDAGPRRRSVPVGRQPRRRSGGAPRCCGGRTDAKIPRRGELARWPGSAAVDQPRVKLLGGAERPGEPLSATLVTPGANHHHTNAFRRNSWFPAHGLFAPTP